MLKENHRNLILNEGRSYFEKFIGQRKFKPGQDYIPVTTKVVDAEDLAILLDSALDMWLTAGRFSNEFEKKIGQYFGRGGRSLLVNSGSSANLVAVSALGSKELKKSGLEPLKPGDEVLTVAAGFPTTVNPIVQNGWVPVFVDVEAETLNTTLELIQNGMSSKTRAVVIAHTLGNPFRADLISEWCQKNNLFLIEDCCDAFGATIGNKSVGSFGDFATLSFYPAHHITMGEGGGCDTCKSPIEKNCRKYS